MKPYQDLTLTAMNLPFVSIWVKLPRKLNPRRVLKESNLTSKIPKYDTEHLSSILKK
jgi:hypothetical protein